MISVFKNTECPSGFEASPSGGCYRFNTGARIFDVARRSCQGYPDGDLVVIDDQDELDYLMGRSADLNNGTWWIGMCIYIKNKIYYIMSADHLHYSITHPICNIFLYVCIY